MDIQKIIYAFILGFGVNCAMVAQSLVINEVVYTNREILQDVDGDTPDYIELFNAGEKDINLMGYQLIDDTSKSTFWVLPDVILPAKDFLLIYASGKDKIDNGEMHTKFRLSQMKDDVFLFDANGGLIDHIEAGCVPSDLTISRVPDGAPAVKITSPTPGTSNNNALVHEIDFVADTLFSSHISGFYNEPIQLTLNKVFEQNTIYYTLNGDEPDENAMVYSDAIELIDLTLNKNRFANQPETFQKPGNKIFKGNILRAKVYSSGCPASNEISNVYFIDKSKQTQYNIPVVSIITEDKNLFDDDIGIYTKGKHTNYGQHGKAWERPVHVEIFDNEKNMVIEQDAGIRISGQGSRKAPQKSLRLYARKEYGKTHFEYPFFPQKPELNRFRTLLLRSSRGLSGTLFKDELTQNLVQQMNMNYSGTQTAITFINGEYWGIYSLRERLDDGYFENNFGFRDQNADIIRHGLIGLELENGSWDSYESLIDFLENSDSESQTFYSEASELIDIPQLIDFYVSQMYFANFDFPHNNIKTWKLTDPGSKWKYYFFDCDACMINVKQDQLSEYNNTVQRVQEHEDWAIRVLRKLMFNEQFRNEFSKAFYFHLQHTFNPNRVIAEIERLEDLYTPLVGEQTYRWHQPVNYTKWKNNVDMLKVFAMQRPSVQLAQLVENFGEPIKLYPNPSTGIINLDFGEGLNEVEIQIFSLAGQEKFHGNYSNTTPPLNIELSLEPGIYVTRIINNQYTQTNKLIIK